ncbi:kinase-like protein [Gigaspora margarita]|uniref:Kinase-like protein n=1 Tax=Gigaspora margarita TaxID=4874 RepID=A0A8H4AYG8_GIGMA|nr:kinase-like protein [Gigaspora margarita]
MDPVTATVVSALPSLLQASLQLINTIKQTIKISINNKHVDCSLEFIQYYYTGKCVKAPESIINCADKHTTVFERIYNSEGMICYNITKPSFDREQFYYLLISWKAQFGISKEFCVQLCTEQFPVNKEEKRKFFEAKHTLNPQSPGYIFKWPKDGETPKVKFKYTTTMTDSNDCEINVCFRDFDNYESNHYAKILKNPRYRSMINKTISSRTAVSTEIINDIRNLLNVDLCFVLDCTGSTDEYILAAKNYIKKLIKSMNKVNPKIKIWFGFCGYRDYDDKDHLQSLEFTDSYKRFENFVTNMRANGGDDFPEDVLGRLNRAIKMKWMHDTRILIHIGDAPPHGALFNASGASDNYPNGHSDRLSAENVLSEMKSKKNHLFFREDYRKNRENAQYISRNNCNEAFLAISHTVISMKSGKDAYLLQCSNNEPNWLKLTTRNAILSSYTPLRSLDEAKNNKYITEQNCKTENFTFKIALKPFASGAEKDVYYDREEQYQKVMKKYKNSEIDKPYLESVEIASVALFLSDKFNSAAKKFHIKKIEFLQVFFLKDVRQRRLLKDVEQHYIVEKKLDNFERFNSNIGVIVKYRPVLEAHFTYDFTGEYLFVCDLQGANLIIGSH